MSCILCEKLAQEKSVLCKTCAVEWKRDLKHLFDNETGIKFLYVFQEICGSSQNAMTGNSWTYFNLGMDKVFKILMTEIAKAEPQLHWKVPKFKIDMAMQAITNNEE